MSLVQTLAILADEAYDGHPNPALPAGFQTADLPGVPLAGGIYNNGPAAALVTTATIDGQQTLVVAFRGSDDNHDWLADLRDINAAYAKFQPLVSALEQYAAAGGHVLVVGHSLGGAIAQIFMSEHTGDAFRAVTFGSPGALPEAGVFAAGADARITNYAVSDDPFVFLGEHRVEVADFAALHPLYGATLAAELSQASGLALVRVEDSLPFMTADYVNNGTLVTLPGEAPSLSVPTIIAADPNEHEPSTYVTLTGMSGVPDPVLW